MATLYTTVDKTQKQAVKDARQFGNESEIVREALKQWFKGKKLYWPEFQFIPKIGTVPILDPGCPHCNAPHSDHRPMGATATEEADTGCPSPKLESDGQPFYSGE